MLTHHTVNGVEVPIRCDCGQVVDVDGPLEDAHFVFGIRADGTRSNLGYCPVKSGMAAAIRKARVTSMQLGAIGHYYQGKVVR